MAGNRGQAVNGEYVLERPLPLQVASSVAAPAPIGDA